MSKFTERTDLEELIDQPGIPFADWEVCLNELNAVNTLLGGHAITIDGVKKLLKTTTKKRITITEIGCGGGDNLKAIDSWNRKTNTISTIRFVGIDINKACTDFAANNCRGLNAEFITSDYRHVSFGEDKPEIIFNSLFCHHFKNDELIEMLHWMRKNSYAGFFINDLHRHPFAYYSIKFLTRLFSRSYLVKNDGPISVLRGFRKHEWQDLMKEAKITSYSIYWRWAFRHLVVVRNEGSKNI